MTFQKPPGGVAGMGKVAGEWYSHVTDVIKRGSAGQDRSQQTAIGPSEVGTECPRRLAYKLLDWPASNPDSDPWPSLVGTGMHAVLADLFGWENARLGRERYLLEQRVQIPGLPRGGSCDLFDTDTGIVCDWKGCGSTTHKKYRKQGPGQQYRTQAHLYGLGYALLGQDVRHVAIVFFLRSGLLSDTHVWAEEFQPQIAVDALLRLEATKTALMTVDPEANPAMWEQFPTADAYCGYCPNFLPGSTDLSQGCPGHAATVAELGAA